MTYIEYFAERGIPLDYIKSFVTGIVNGEPVFGLQYPLSDISSFIRENHIIYYMIGEHGNLNGYLIRNLTSDPKYRVIGNRAVFGINWALPFIYNNSVIVVEGPTDFFALQFAGFKNTVCLLGTTVSKYQVLRLLRYTNKFILVFDGDSMGREAAYNLTSLVQKYGGSVLRLDLPAGIDPDIYLKSNKEQLCTQLKGLMSQFTFQNSL